MPVDMSDANRDFDLTGRQIYKLRFLSRLGSSKSPVWKAIDKGSFGNEERPVAVKVFINYNEDYQRKDREKQVFNEIKALGELPGLSSLIRYYYDHSDSIYVIDDESDFYLSLDDALRDGHDESQLNKATLTLLVMEYLDGNNLITDEFRKYARDNYRIVCKFLHDVAVAIGAIHKKKLAHRDIKPANLFWSTKNADDKIVLGDFGEARSTDPMIRSGNVVGTYPYLATEAFEPKLDLDLMAVDVYAFAVTLYEVLTEQRPVVVSTSQANSGKDPDALWHEAHREFPRVRPREHVGSMSLQLDVAIHEAMNPRPELRLTIDRIAEALKNESEMKTSAIIPTNYFSEAPKYRQGKIREIPEYAISPSFRMSKLSQVKYTVEMQIDDTEPQIIERIHKALVKHIGPAYKLLETYGEWSFIVYFWRDPHAPVEKLFEALGPNARRIRVTTCGFCQRINANGRLVDDTRNAKHTKAHIEGLLYSYFHSSTTEQQAYYFDELVKSKSIYKLENNAHRLIHAACFIGVKDEFRRQLSPDALRRIVLDTLSNVVRDNRGIVSAEFYERAHVKELEAPLNRNNLELSKSDYVIAYTVKEHEDLYCIPDVFIRQIRGLHPPVTRIATSWYTIWREFGKNLFPSAAPEPGNGATIPPDESPETPRPKGNKAGTTVDFE